MPLLLPLAVIFAAWSRKELDGEIGLFNVFPSLRTICTHGLPPDAVAKQTSDQLQLRP